MTAEGKAWWRQAFDDAHARITNLTRELETMTAENAHLRRVLGEIADYAKVSAEVDPKTQSYADHILTSIANTARNALKETK